MVAVAPHQGGGGVDGGDPGVAVSADDEGGVQLALHQWLVVQVLGLTCGLSKRYIPVNSLLTTHATL